MIEHSTRFFTGRHMFAILLGFFGIVFGANMTLVYFANHSWTGLVVQNSYVASQEFNTTTGKLEKAALDVHSALEYHAGILRITLSDNAGKPVNAANVKLQIGRPSNEGEDQTISLARVGEGEYETGHQLAKGQWSGDVTADIAGRPQWQRPIRLLIKE